jgi:hypothetical protein
MKRQLETNPGAFLGEIAKPKEERKDEVKKIDTAYNSQLSQLSDG